MSVANVGNIPVSSMTLPEMVNGFKHLDSNHSEARVKPHVINSTAAELERTFNRKLQFVVDQNSREVIVKVIDKETDKVIKEIPPEELQRLHRNIKDAIGLVFDKMA
ncbi:MAG: flagellar protein FlaG [Treponema sp.]|nr:flagellar protein FlaG [Treponema sp.]